MKAETSHVGRLYLIEKIIIEENINKLHQIKAADIIIKLYSFTGTFIEKVMTFFVIVYTLPSMLPNNYARKTTCNQR